MTPPDSSHDVLVEALLAAARGGAMPGLESAVTPEERELLLARLQQARALVALPRRPAPATLTGYVVAALQAGAREARAVDAVREVAARGPHTAPLALDERVAASIDRLRAPGELDTFVAERLARPGAGLAQSFLGRLPRLTAPDELATRLGTPGPTGRAGLEFVAPRGRGRFGPLRALQGAVLGASAALLLYVVGGRLGADGPGDVAAERSLWSERILVPPVVQGDVLPLRPRVPLTFDLVGHDSIRTAQLSPVQRAIVGGLADEMMEGGS